MKKHRKLFTVTFTGNGKVHVSVYSIKYDATDRVKKVVRVREYAKLSPDGISMRNLIRFEMLSRIEKIIRPLLYGYYISAGRG